MTAFFDVLALAGVLMTGHPDAFFLKAQADSIGVPAVVAWAVVWEETRGNTNHRIRGHLCWNRVVRQPDCEVGRFQIKPSTGRARCPGLNIWTYAGNVRCGLAMLAADGRRYGYPDAIRRHNGRGPLARAYRDRVLARVGLYVLTLPSEVR